MKTKHLTLLVATLIGIGAHTAAFAVQTPNYYECTGKNISLNLAIGSKAEVGILPPQTRMNLQIGKKNYSFQEQDITTESTLIGGLWEVTLKFIPDLYIDHASVLIPSIALNSAPISFKSQLILTRVNTPFIPTPYEGVVNTSKYIDIACTASMLFY